MKKNTKCKARRFVPDYLLRIMRMYFLFVILGIGSLFASSSYSQSTKLSLHLKNVSIEDVFSEIEKNSEYIFFYKETVPVNSKVSVHAKEETLDQILDKVLEPNNLSYKINDRQVVVTVNKKEDAVLSAQVSQQEKVTVAGIVTDDSGIPLIGVSVVVKGTSTGTVTDIDGRFSLTVPGPDAILAITYIGYELKEIKVGTQTNITVILVEDVKVLDEVVVVGYGTQKKANLTGSVASIQSQKIESRPITNVSSSLSGLAAGVSVSQKSGNPGSDDANIRIRGTGTFSDDHKGPMVIIDGAQGNMDSVNPDDIESISVLKDAASAAIYGSRAANGVILITTKKGRQEATPRVTYTGIFSSEQPSNTIDFMTDYATYMDVFNRSMKNIDQTERYKKETIEAWRNAAKNPNSTDNEWSIPNSLAYPNTDWADALFSNNLFQKHNLSVSGGSKNSNYLLSLMYMDNPGTMENTGLKRYQFRVNAETKISDFLKIGTQTYAMKQDKEPGNESSAFNFLFQTVPGMTPVHNGQFGYPEAAEEDGTANNLFWFLHNTGGVKTTTRVNTTWYAGFDIYKGLTAEGRFNYQEYRFDADTYDQSNNMYSFRTNDIKRYGTQLKDAAVTYDSDRSFEYTATATLNYMGDFGDHSINALLGYEQYYYDMKELYVQSKGLMDFSITDIGTAMQMVKIWGSPDPGDSNKQKDTGAQYDYGMLSWFGRLNYAYKGKYLFEANFRRDASSRFSPDSRWGTFPSFSGAWRISEESFMESTKGFMDNLKLRASWGQLGNTTSGYYDWQAAYGIVPYSFGSSLFNGLAQQKLANPGLQWESITSTGIGLDASFLKQRFNVEIDYYNKLTEGILTSPPIYLTMGTVNPPTKNTSDMRNRGVELTLGWNDRIGEVQYSVSANFSYNQNKIVKYLGQLEEGWVDGEYKTNVGKVSSYQKDSGDREIQTEGHMFNEYYLRSRYNGTGTYKTSDGKVDPSGGPRDGMIRTAEDLQWVRDMQAAGYSFQIPIAKDAAGNEKKTGLWYGEYIMADNNGDKIYGNAHDREFTGKSAIPKYGYGLNITAVWKGFDFSMQWAGNGGMYYWLNERGVSSSNLGSRTVLAADAVGKYYYYDESNPSNPANNINGEYPRLRFESNGALIDNDLYLYNASYIKLKNLQFGYTFPKKWMEKIYVNNLRLFLSGENLATITEYPGIDPEMGAGINVYPTSRQYSVGVNLTF